MTLRRLTPIVILLLALSLRLYQLDYRALWWDEGLSLLFARLDYINNAHLAVTLADTNPPIYRLLLGIWINLAGSSAWVTRLFSVLPGVVLVAVICRLARALRFNRAVGVSAMLLGAASPMLIYYSQEAKGYSLVALAATASVLVWMQLLPVSITHTGSSRQSRDWWPWLFYTLCLLLSIGSHYISAFLILTQNLWTLALTIRAWRGNERPWLLSWARLLGAQATAALCLVPFVVLTFSGTSAAVRGETGEFQNLDTIGFIARHILELTQGPTADGVWAWMVAGVMGLVVVSGWGLNNRKDTIPVGISGWRPEQLRRWFLATWILIPVALGFALNSYHSFFFPRFVLYTVPPLLLLLAHGLDLILERLYRFLPQRFTPHTPRSTAHIFLLLLWLPALLSYYNLSTAPGEDWRPVAETLRPLVRPGDEAIYVWGWIPGYLDAYLPPAPQPTYTLGFFTPESLDGEMRKIIAGRERLWLLDYEIDQFDVRNLAGAWLRPRAALVYDAWPGEGKAHVALFALTPTSSHSATIIRTEFANGLRLEVTELQTELAPGDALALALVWEATRPLTERYTIFLHGGADHGALAFGRDSEPNNGLSIVTDWQPGQRQTELRGLLIPPDTLPGRYVLSLGMYQTATGEVDAKGAVLVGAVVVK